MRRNLNVLFSICCLFAFQSVSSQIVIYSEDFDGALTWTLNTDPMAEGANPNQWFISCVEEGVGAGFCADEDCTVGDNTLHIGINPLGGPELGAVYGETPIPGMTTTNRRAESADISTVGHTDISLNFDFIALGNALDFAEVFYSIDGGGTWTLIDGPLTSLCCGGVACDGALDGLWETASYLLPAECEGIANLRISFVWQNVDDNDFSNISIGVDNLTITKEVVAVDGGPTALFDPEDITICQGESITYTDMSLTDDVISAWSWVFGGGTPGTALTAGPHVITYSTPGVFTTSLTVTDGIGSHDTTFTVTVLDGPYSGPSRAIDVCEGDIIDLNTLLTGADGGGTWVETTGAPSGTFTPGTGELDAGGLPIGGVFTFDYTTGPGVAPCDFEDVATITVTIIACEALRASFVPSSYEICVDDCLTFTDLSEGTGIINWVWSFSDPGIGGPIIGVDPGTVCFTNAGAINVMLTITDGVVTDDTTITITVNPKPNVLAMAAPSTTVCLGDNVTLTGAGADFYVWTGGVTDGLAFAPLVSTSYTVTGTNAFGCTNSDDITITVVECEPLIPGFEFDDIICIGDCITLRDTSLGGPVSWLWDFDGGGEPAGSTEKEPVICFNIPGLYNIQLTVMNGMGESASTTKTITVYDVPLVSAEMDTIIDLAGRADLIAVGFPFDGDFAWEPYDDIECPTCPITSANPPSDEVYVVTLTDVNGCKATDTVMVYVNFIESLGVPEAFSPNGDNVNDILFVKGFGFEFVNLKVYNKYGQMMFESSVQEIGWDGTFNGRDENPGVFTWVVEYKFINGRGGVKQGNTTLIR